MEAEKQDNIRVLVVDDEPSILEIITFMLENEGYIVANAATGSAALEKVVSFRPDLILLDVMLPETDGIEVARNLKNNFRTRHIPIIMVSAKRDIEDKVLGMEIGADDYVTKPFSREELLARVKMVLRRTRDQLDRNPLTGLPGNIYIEVETRKLMKSGEHFNMLYVDIDNFKPFNDYYGYDQGDVAIEILRDVILNTVEKLGTSMDIVAHIGGDDFIIITFSDSTEKIADEIINGFSRQSKSLFPKEDIKRGYFVTVDRKSKKSTFKCNLTISVALIKDIDSRFTNYAQLVDSAMELKRYAKSIGGNRYVEERRVPNNSS